MMDKKMMDPSTLWQWRIRHVKEFSKCSDPFKHSHVIGLDFNVGSIKHRRVDLKLVTNGVIIEICNFAETVTRGKKHFIAHILENNFDLGLDNEQQRVDFTNELARRVEDLLRKPSTDKHEVFPLFDTPDCDGNKKGLNMEGFSEELDKAHVEDIKHPNRVHCSEEHSDDVQEDFLVSTFPYSVKIGLNFGVEAKQSLDQGLLTKGVMLEVAHLAKVLCGSYNAIILKVLEHNFELDLGGQEEKNQVLFSITALMKRTKQLRVSINQIISTFRNEQFPFHTVVEECDLFNKDAQQSHLDEVTEKTLVLKGKKQKRTLVDTDEPVSKRCRREQSEDVVPHHTDLDAFQITDSDSLTSLTWLLEECIPDLKREMDSNNAEDQDGFKKIFGKSESSCESIQNPVLTTGNSCSSLPTGSQPVPSYLNEMKRCVFQELTHTSTNVHDVCDMEKKNIETTVSTKHEEKALLVTDEPVSKREQSGHRDHHDTDFGSCEMMPPDDFYMCPLSESDLDSDGEIDSWNVDCQDEKHLSSLSSEIQKESVSSVAGFQRRFLSATDRSSSSPSVNAPPGGYTDDTKSSENCEQTHRLRHTSNGCDIDQEEILTEDNLWKMRANRVKCILSFCNEEYYLFPLSKKAGIDFNVGFGPKQKHSVDRLKSEFVLEIAKFAAALSSSQRDITMDILEHNFDLHLENDSDWLAFAYETMNRVGQLRNSDVPKSLKETFELPLPKASVKQMEENMSSVSSASIQEECTSQDCSQNSHPEAEEIVSEENVDPYPYCKEIGLKLLVNKSQPVKLDVNTLTKGAMSEVANFADKLSGTFEEIFLDVLKHNYDFDNQSYHSDLANIIFMCIPLLVEEKNLSSRATKVPFVCKFLDPRLEYQNTDVDVCTSGSSQAPAVNQNVGSSAETELQNEPSEAKELWKLRAHKIKEILSYPHTEHCPLSSYSRCKKIGMDFNIGSGVKPNLDAKLLTNGIMVAVNSFAEELHNATDYFLTEILEYNFHLDLKDEQYRKAFERVTLDKFRRMKRKKNFRKEMLFEFPSSSRVRLKIHYPKSTFCPKCYQIRNQQPGEDASVPGYMTETASADCSSQKLVVCPEVEKTIMDSYPSCKEIGLTLCVNKNKPREKLSEHVLSYEVVKELSVFATKLCAETRTKIIDDIIEHNFNISAKLSPASQFRTKCFPYDATLLSWLNEVFVVEPFLKKKANKKVKKNNKIKKRLRAMQNKMERDARNICNGCDMEQEEFETEDNMWKMRAKRVKNILSEMSRDFWDFYHSGITSLELNIGFGAKKNFSSDYLTAKLVVKVVEFVIAMNSSQQDFIIEILDKNFDLKLKNDLDRTAFAYETMKRVRQLKNSEDIIKFSKELFELPVPIISNQSMACVRTKLTSASRKMEWNSENCSQDSLPEAKENVSEKSDNPYPFCKEIGLKLLVNKSQPVKLDVDTLTNGAMVEVANFTEKLCGTFEQIFLDILRHNFDLENQNEYSDLVKHILLHIPLMVEQNNLTLFPKTYTNRMIPFRLPLVTQLLSPSIDLDIFGSGSSQTPTMNHNVGSSFETEHQNEPSEEKELWRMRANHVKQILSKPHEHHCPLYPYPRCKKIGMDFSLASGVKPNLDLNLLTNGLMVEIHTFASALHSATEQVLAEILEYNFHLDMKNDDYRRIFGQQVLYKIKQLFSKKRISKKLKLFELPDSKEIEVCYTKTTYCPKCNQTTNQTPGQDEHLSGYVHHQQPHVKPETTSVEANCSPQKPFIFSAVEKKILNHYPLCKEMGLNLCVNKAQPKKKLPKHLLTYGAMYEVLQFTRRFCGISIGCIANDVLKHYFNIPYKDMNTMLVFYQVMTKSDGHLAWLNEVFIPQPMPPRILMQRVEPKTKLKLRPRAKKCSSFMSTEQLYDGTQNVWFEVPFAFSSKAKEKGQEHKRNKGNPISSLDKNYNPVFSTDHGRTQGHAQIKVENPDPQGDAGPDTPHIYHPHYQNVKSKPIVQYSVKRRPPTSSSQTWVTMCPNSTSGGKTEPIPEVLNYYSLPQPLGLKGSTMATVCPDTANTRLLVPVKAAESQGCSTMTVRQDCQIKAEQQSVSAGSHVTVPPPDLRHDISTQTKKQMPLKEEEDL